MRTPPRDCSWLLSTMLDTSIHAYLPLLCFGVASFSDSCIQLAGMEAVINIDDRGQLRSREVRQRSIERKPQDTTSELKCGPSSQDDQNGTVLLQWVDPRPRLSSFGTSRNWARDTASSGRRRQPAADVRIAKRSRKMPLQAARCHKTTQTDWPRLSA